MIYVQVNDKMTIIYLAFCNGTGEKFNNHGCLIFTKVSATVQSALICLVTSSENDTGHSLINCICQGTSLIVTFNYELGNHSSVWATHLKHDWDFTSSMEVWCPCRSTVICSSGIVSQTRLTNEIDF